MQLDRLELAGGGWVEFKDSDELDTNQYLAVKALLNTDLMQTISRAQTLVAQLLISAWEIPNAGRLPIPSAKKGGPAVINQVHWKTWQKIEGHVTRVVNEILLGDDGDDEDGEGGEGKAEPTSE